MLHNSLKSKNIHSVFIIEGSNYMTKKVGGKILINIQVSSLPDAFILKPLFVHMAKRRILWSEKTPRTASLLGNWSNKKGSSARGIRHRDIAVRIFEEQLTQISWERIDIATMEIVNRHKPVAKNGDHRLSLMTFRGANGNGEYRSFWHYRKPFYVVRQ